MSVNAIRTDNGIRLQVACEAPGCRNVLDLPKKVDYDNLGKFLSKSKTWGWLLGDELYDHYCCKTCKEALQQEHKRQNDTGPMPVALRFMLDK